MANEEKTFDQKVATFINSLKNTKRHALDLSQEAFQHAMEHGNMAKLQVLLEVFENHGKNFIRVTAFKKWMVAHGPITMKDGKLVKDKSENAIEWNLAGALKKPFWEFAPDQEAFTWTLDDGLKIIESFIRKTEKDDAKPVNEAAVQVVVDMKKFVESHRKVNQDLDDEAAKAQAPAQAAAG